MKTNTCCFFGHKTISVTAELELTLNRVIRKLIVENKVDTFLFGSKSQFNDLCYEQVTKLREEYPDIKRVYVRAEFSEISDVYRAYLLRRYEDTYYPQKALNAGKAVYVRRNYEMIDKSNFCVVYYREEYSPASRKSGTKCALDYALKNKRIIFMLPKREGCLIGCNREMNKNVIVR